MRKKNFKRDFILFLIPLIIFSLLLMLLYPGIYTPDSYNQWGQVQKGIIGDAHPFFSTYFMYLLSKIWNNQAVLPVFQIIIFSLFWSIMCHFTRTNTNYKKQIIFTFFISLIPLVGIYSITVWKDILYSYYLAMAGFLTYMIGKKGFKASIKELIILGLLLAFVYFYRHNGAIVSLIYVPVFTILYLKNNHDNKRKIFALILTFVLIVGIISIPKKIYVEKYNEIDKTIQVTLPTQYNYISWMWGGYLKEGLVEEEDLKFLDNIMDTKSWGERYSAYTINPTFCDENVDKQFIIDHGDEYRNMFLKYSFRYPSVILKHYIKADSLLYSPISQDYTYVYVYTLGEVVSNSSFPSLAKTYQKFVNSTFNYPFKYFYQPGLILILSLLVCIYQSKKYKDKNIYLAFLPTVLNTVSLLPINLAQDLRYCYINYLNLIILLLIWIMNSSKYIDEINCNQDKNGVLKKKKNPKTLFVIPAYNEVENIGTVLDELAKDASFADVLVINDCSKDNTEEIVRKHNAKCITGIFNLRYAWAVQTGIKYAYQNDYDYVIQFDADGQHIASEAVKLLKAMQKDNVDIVIGSRYLKDMGYPCPFFRRIGTKWFEHLIKLFCHQRIADPLSGFQCLNRSVIKRYAQMGKYPEFPDANLVIEMLLSGYRIEEIPVKMRIRENGESMHGGIIKPIKYMINMFYTICFIVIQNIGSREVKK